MGRYTLSAAEAVSRAANNDRTLYSALRPVLIGPRAGLHRYAVAGEKTDISLGAYDPLEDTDYDYPDKTDGSVVDLASVKLFADDADLNYFSKFVGSNGSCQPSATYPNRVRAANFIFKSSDSADRSATFYDRDVKIGDIAYVRGVDGDDTYELTTSVTGFVGETVAATVDTTPTVDANNASTQTLDVSIEQVDGTPFNDVTATADASSYLSTADGYINRTYTITVTQSSTGNDATTALLRVRSADGLDDQDDVSPAAFGDPTDIGTKGLTVTFDIDTDQSSASLYGIDEDDLVVGQQWTVEVSQAFTAPTATGAGTYTGTEDTTYIVTVTRGGRYADATKPQITVTSTTGYDRSGPTTVTASASATAVGGYGVTIAFSQTALRKGDVWYIAVTAATEGAYKTLVLKDSVDDAITGSEVDLRLFARRQGLEIPRARSTPDSATNWTRTADGVTINGEIDIVDDEFTDDGVLVPMPLDSGTLYLEYREWIGPGEGIEVVEVAAADEVEAALGLVDPDNPIAYAADKALANTAGELLNDPTRPAATTTDRILCVSIGGDPTDTDLWTAALELLEENDEAYQIVPLSETPAILTLVATHVANQSADSTGFYSTCWLPSTMTEIGAVVDPTTTTNDLAATATITATPATSPTKYTTVTASANAVFVTNGVRAGDLLRINFDEDELGEEIYDEYVVASVTSNTVLVLESGPDAAIAVARRIEIWREYTKDELVTQLTTKAAVFDSERVKYVFPDTVGDAGETVGGEFLCANLAGLAGSVPSHQGLRNVSPVGFDDFTRASRFFTATQLTTLAAGGVFVVSQTSAGTPYVRTANTTDVTSVSTREEMIVRNADMIRKAVQDEWAPYVGAGNTVSNLQSLLEGALASLEGRIKAASNSDRLGPPLGALRLSAIESVEGHADTVAVTLEVTGIAVPLNQIRVVLPVSV